jgi:hypothetical protein
MKKIDYGKIRSNAIASYGGMTAYLNDVLYLLNNTFRILCGDEPTAASKYFLPNFTGQSTVIPDLDLLIDLADGFAT